MEGGASSSTGQGVTTGHTAKEAKGRRKESEGAGTAASKGVRGGTKTGGKEAGAGPSFFDSAEAEDPFAQLECELDSWEGARRGASGDNEGRVGNGKGQGRAAVVLKLAEVVGPPSWWEDKRIGSRRRSGSPHRFKRHSDGGDRQDGSGEEGPQ